MALLPGLGLTGCGDDNPWSGSDQEGGIALNLESDGRLMSHTRADDTKCPIVPDASAFAVKLTKSDLTFSKTWSSIDGFNKETKFSIGDYTIEATYGDVTVQGFDNPCFKGSNTVHVSPGAVTPVNVTATLANSMVTLRYTDKFVENFPNYSAAIQTPGHEDFVIFAQEETRPAFIDPTGDGDVVLVLTLTNSQGKQVTVSPAKFTARPRCNYIITVDVKGNVVKGDLALDIQFEEEVAHETIQINLGDELFDSPAPEVRATNFTVGTPVELMEYDELPVSPQFDIYAFGGFREVSLEVINTNGTYVPGFGSNVELCGADAVTQALLANEGVKVSGLFRNPDKMAVVNVKGLLGKLPAGEYTVRVTAMDQAGRISTQTVTDPVELKASVAKTEYTIQSAGNVDFMTDEVGVVVNTNAQQLKDRIRFRVGNADATVKSVTAGSASAPGRTRSDLPYTYTYVLGIPKTASEKIQVESTYGRLSATVAVTVNSPEYTVDVDAFSRFAVFRINADNADMREYLTGNLDVYRGNSVVTPGNLSRDAENGLITVKGLSANNTFADYKLKIGGLFEKAVPSFNTEAEASVPNGDFGVQGTNLLISNIASGGKFRASLPPDYQFKTTINIFEPKDWASINSFTCYEGSTNRNTWFMVPSTYMDNGAVVVRSVGYSHNGTDPALSNFVAATYSKNAPEHLDVAAGELFLGSYSYDGAEHRDNGIAFTSRPMSVSFDYRYTPLNGEQAQADVQLIAQNGDVLASSTVYLSAASDMTGKTVNIDRYVFGRKASKLYIRFRSTKDGVTPAIYKPTGDELKQPGHNGISSTLDENSYKAFAKGSELTVDNVKVWYEGVPAITNKQAKKRVK